MPKKTKPSDTAPLTTTSAIPRGVVINGTAPVLAYNGPVITHGGYLTDPAPIAWGGPEHMTKPKTKTKPNTPVTDVWHLKEPFPMTSGPIDNDAVSHGTDQWDPSVNGDASKLLTEAFQAAAKNSVTPTHTIDSLSTVLDAATQAILTQRADVMPQAVKVAQAALERLLEALQVDHKAKEGAK